MKCYFCLCSFGTKGLGRVWRWVKLEWSLLSRTRFLILRGHNFVGDSMNLENMALGIPWWSTVFTAKSLGSISGQGSKITQAEGHSQKKQRNKQKKKTRKKQNTRKNMALYSLLVTQNPIPMTTLLLKHRFKLGSDDVISHLIFHSKQMR